MSTPLQNVSATKITGSAAACDAFDPARKPATPTAHEAVKRFLERVVPWPELGQPGWVNIHWMKRGAKVPYGRPFDNVTGAVKQVATLLADPTITDIYACMSLQAKTKV